MDDGVLREAVLDEADFEPSVNGAHIGVTAERGVVTPTGHVFSFAEKVAAERAVVYVRGVRAVAQEIEVRCPDQKPDLPTPELLAPPEIIQRPARAGMFWLNPSRAGQGSKAGKTGNFRPLLDRNIAV